VLYSLSVLEMMPQFECFDSKTQKWEHCTKNEICQGQDSA